ncbi:MAG: HlyD family efflux transporter periplasmic adaptor subunit [Aestuariivita sp.]|nr:HlyD family efflux transporter periplasmic adaptor subunit [Aestuariivita sp.]MCY4203640.1 HlyD family efflux transporter periplasmic adaptor subunit [Aestuariivita sp.]
MRFLRQSLVGVMLTALTLGFLAYAGQLIHSAVQDRLTSQPSAQNARERVYAVHVIPARHSREIPEFEAFGEIQSLRTLEIRAAAGGRVATLAPEFRQGGVVESDQLLIGIDPADRQASLDRSKSDLLDAQAEVRDAERSAVLANDELAAALTQFEVRQRALRRQQDLLDRGVGNATGVENAEISLAQAQQSVLSRRIAVAQAEARVDQAATRLARSKIALGQAERDLSDTKIYAPFAGTLNDVTLVEGRLVSANEKVAELVDPDALEVAFRVSTRQYVRLLDNNGVLLPTRVIVTLEGAEADLPATGRVTRHSAGTGALQTGRVLYASLSSAYGFKPGDFVTVAVQEQALDDVIRLPASAFGSDGAVLALTDADRLQAIPATLLRRQGDDVLVQADDLVGKDVVKSRTPLLGPGIRVRPVRNEAPDSVDLEMLELAPDRKAKLVAFIESNSNMPEAARARILNQLAQEKVPAQVVERLEARIGG